MHDNALKRFLCVLNINRTIHVFFAQRNQGEARFHGSRHVSQEFGRDAEPYGAEAHGDVVRTVQGDCGVHAPGVAEVARQRGPH